MQSQNKGGTIYGHLSAKFRTSQQQINLWPYHQAKQNVKFYLQIFVAQINTLPKPIYNFGSIH